MLTPNFEDTAYTDDDLIEGLKRRDQSLCAVFHRRFAPRMLAVANRITRCDQEAQDAVQDAMISALQSIHAFAGESRLGTWLHRIVVNAALMRLRHRSRLAKRAIDDSGVDLEQHAGDDSCVITEVSDDEMAVLLRRCVDSLPPSYRQIIQLRDLEEHDTTTTARMLHCSEANVKTRLHRARRTLRELLEPYACVRDLPYALPATPTSPRTALNSRPASSPLARQR